LLVLGESDALGLSEHAGLGLCKICVIPRHGHLCGAPERKNWYQLGLRYMFMTASFGNGNIYLMSLGAILHELSFAVTNSSCILRREIS
jgi:hypothetical protein